MSIISNISMFIFLILFMCASLSAGIKNVNSQSGIELENRNSSGIISCLDFGSWNSDNYLKLCGHEILESILNENPKSIEDVILLNLVLRLSIINEDKSSSSNQRPKRQIINTVVAPYSNAIDQLTNKLIFGTADQVLKLSCRFMSMLSNLTKSTTSNIMSQAPKVVKDAVVELKIFFCQCPTSDCTNAELTTNTAEEETEHHGQLEQHFKDSSSSCDLRSSKIVILAMILCFFAFLCSC